MSLTASKPLTATEESALIAEARIGNTTALEALVTSQLRFIRSEASKYARFQRVANVDVEDLVSAGLEALLGALDSFDPNRGVRLFTHAQYSIREAMADEVAAYGSSIPVPGRTLRRYRKAIRATQTLAEARDFAKASEGMDAETFDAVHAAVSGMASLDGASDSDEGSLIDRLDSETTRVMGNGVSSSETTVEVRFLVRQAIASLEDERSKTIVGLAFLASEPMTDAAIAAHLGISRPTVTRTRNHALALMREALA
jgi:RNA polymerase sigma factor (sigma-70 family)